VGEASGPKSGRSGEDPSAHKTRRTSHATQRRTQPSLTHRRTIKSLQFESVSMKTGRNAKKMLWLRFLDRLRTFHGSIRANSSRGGGGNRTVGPHEDFHIQGASAAVARFSTAHRCGRNCNGIGMQRQSRGSRASSSTANPGPCNSHRTSSSRASRRTRQSHRRRARARRESRTSHRHRSPRA
jgi:hypothetical protein